MASQPDFGLLGSAAQLTNLAPSVQQALLGEQQIQQNRNILNQQAMVAEQQKRALTADDIYRAVQGQIVSNPQMDDAQFGEALRPLVAVDPARAAQLQQARLRDRDFSSYFAKPTAQDAARLMVTYPDVRESISKGWDTINEYQRKHMLRLASDIYGYLRSGDTQKAAEYARSHIAGQRAAGEDTTQLEQIADLIPNKPSAALGMVQLMIAGENPEKFSQTFKDLGEDQREEDLHDDKMRKAKAEADIAESNSAWADVTHAAEVGLIKARAGNFYSLISKRAKMLGKSPRDVTIDDMKGDPSLSSNPNNRKVRDFFHRSGAYDNKAPTATDPKTGRKVRFNRASGQWEAM